MEQFPISYPYKPKKWSMMFSFFFLVLATYIWIEIALTNDRGLKLILIRHVLKFSFSPSEVTLCCWVLSILGGILSLIGFFVFCSALISKAKIVLTNREISIPSSPCETLNKTVTIPYNEILSLELHQVRNRFSNIRFLKIVHQKGEICLHESFFSQKTAFEEIINTLNRKRD